MTALKDYEKWKKNADRPTKQVYIDTIYFRYGDANALLEDFKQAMTRAAEDTYDKVSYRLQWDGESDSEDPYVEIEGERPYTDKEFEKFCAQMKQNCIDNEKRDRELYERLRTRFAPAEAKEQKKYKQLRKELEEQEKQEREELDRLKSKFGG